MLIYSLLHLTGYDLSIDDLKNFRQLHSRTPGHPEFGYTPGVETTTGPLGQGLANAVGFALAEKVMGAQFNRPGHNVVDHHTYVILGLVVLHILALHEVGSNNPDGVDIKKHKDENGICPRWTASARRISV